MKRTPIPLVAALSMAMIGFAGMTASAAPTGTIEVTYDCDSSEWVITSTKALSNIVVSDGETDVKTEFDADPKIYTTTVGDPDVVTIWVKAGNNKSGDGPGYGQRFDLSAPVCVVDADGDGYNNDVDCNDNDPNVNPGAVDIPNDGIDQNCDGSDLIVGEGELRFTLTWASSDDLDLHVVEPGGDRIWFGDTLGDQGGILDRDDNVGVCGTDTEPGGVENVFWPAGGAPAGTYTIELDNYSDCDDANTGTWTLRAYQDGALIATYTGTEGDNIGLAYSGEFKVFETTHTQP